MTGDIKCPLCGSETVIRLAKKGQNAGHAFHLCVHYPKCKGKMPSVTEIEGKHIAYYSALVQAWIQTRMERDKTLCALSAAGIGLLVTLLTTIGVDFRWEFIPYAFAFVGFVVTIWCTISIFMRNSKYIESIVNESEIDKPNLAKLDHCAKYAFIFAVMCSIAIGFITAWHILDPVINNEGG